MGLAYGSEQELIFYDWTNLLITVFTALCHPGFSGVYKHELFVSKDDFELFVSKYDFQREGKFRDQYNGKANR
jgi:hypothetical protein